MTPRQKTSRTCPVCGQEGRSVTIRNHLYAQSRQDQPHREAFKDFRADPYSTFFTTDPGE